MPPDAGSLLPEMERGVLCPGKGHPTPTEGTERGLKMETEGIELSAYALP